MPNGTIRFTKIHESAIYPMRATPYSAGWDLFALKDVTLFPFMPTLVETGLAVEIDEENFLMICARSGNALKRNISLANGVGIVDSDYRGPLSAILVWSPSADAGNPSRQVIARGERIAQAILMPFIRQSWTQVERLSNTERGTGGFGSTGQ